MIARLKKYWRIILIVAGGLILFSPIGWAGYLHWGKGIPWADWTGFGEYTGQVAKDNRGKTLWDLMELLIIPFVLALGALWLERSERISDRKIAAERREDDKKIAEDRQREAALQAYIDKMTELLLDKEHPLRKSIPDDEVRVVARTRTLATLRKLDPVRKGILLRFLYEGKLITEEHSSMIDDEGVIQDVIQPTVISLSGADLSKADLFAANLSGANLSEANLDWANLSMANLAEAFLSGVNLDWANLFGADLRGANLAEAFLSGADLSGAIFSTKNQLAFVASLEGAIMPDGKKYDPAIHIFD